MTKDPNAALSARRSTLARDGTAIGAEFYDRGTARVARELLGAVVECRADGVLTRARIVEVEAYLGPHDPACHSAVGLTARNRHLHGPPGTAYVYRIYGMHWCVNAVTRTPGFGSAVLVRAVAPVEGVDAMRRRRGTVADRDLTNGPGKTCQALGITGALDGARLDGGPAGDVERTDPLLRVLRGAPVPDSAVLVTPRIGISKAADWPLRFLVGDESHISRTPSAFDRYSVAEANAWLRRRRLR